ncbi:ABC transporter permease [Nostoc sp. FACHB-888]|uniref:ABC transporter permease n=1 Tax=Nostoc sp. FACHB-888 TaxID=2692842 RepID=UPI00322032B0
MGVANIALQTREKLIQVLNSNYALFAYAQGETTSGVILHHGLRNIALPALTLQFASLSELFGGTVLVEKVFGYPGLGSATLQAGLRNDVPLLVGIVLFSAIFVFIGNTLADLSYQVIDPRIRIADTRA